MALMTPPWLLLGLGTKISGKKGESWWVKGGGILGNSLAKFWTGARGTGNGNDLQAGLQLRPEGQSHSSIPQAVAEKQSALEKSCHSGQCGTVHRFPSGDVKRAER